VADQFRPQWPKLGLLMDESEDEVLAYMGFPAAHRTRLHSVNTLERLNKEVKRRADVVGSPALVIAVPEASGTLRCSGC
jgi:transposase-like protein